jgi:hypothetical protein
LHSASGFSLASILGNLRREVGDGEFGYRTQGLFAHVLMALGANVEEIRPQGHPDIVAKLEGQRVLVEVEVASATSRNHVIKLDDLEAISTRIPGESGVLAVLDCAVPIRWIVVDSKTLSRDRKGVILLSTLLAMANQSLSRRCTEAFKSLVECHCLEMKNLTFNLLCARALRGQTL